MNLLTCYDKKRISNKAAVAHFETFFSSVLPPPPPTTFPSPTDKIPSVHKPKERLCRRLIHNPLRNHGVTRWRMSA